jgi:hypothetical protein
VILSGIAGGGRRLTLESDLFALKNLSVDGVFATRRAASSGPLRIIESGRLDVRPLVTHTLRLAEFAKAFDLLSNRPEPVVKVILGREHEPAHLLNYIGGEWLPACDGATTRDLNPARIDDVVAAFRPRVRRTPAARRRPRPGPSAWARTPMPKRGEIPLKAAQLSRRASTRSRSR